MPVRPCARALLSLCALMLPVAGHAETNETQAWLTESLIFTASPKDSVTIDLSERARSDATSGGEQFLGRIGIDHLLAKGVLVGGGFAYLHDQSVHEIRTHQQLTLTHGIWTSRTRIEQRFFDYADGPVWRLRQRVQTAVPLDDKGKWTLIAAGEVFFHLNRVRASDKTGLAMLRNQIGLRHRFSRAVDLQILYMRQQTFRDARPDVVAHIPWATLSWHI